MVKDIPICITYFEINTVLSIRDKLSFFSRIPRNISANSNHCVTRNCLGPQVTKGNGAYIYIIHTAKSDYSISVACAYPTASSTVC